MTNVAEVSDETLTEIGEQVLDDEGQVELSLMLDEGKQRGAQRYLLGAIDELLEGADEEGKEELAALIPQIGLSAAEAERLRTLHINS